MNDKEQKTRLNHYVPEWYQKGFLPENSAKLHYLNLTPDVISLPDGSLKYHRAKSYNSPASCFSQTDLYTTTFGTEINDDIEKLLFGSIDTRGAKAIRAILGGDQNDLIQAFEDFFEYIDAQKLRTPKGLDWIKAHYPTLSQLELMIEMQSLRNMHCTMWAESVREIVTAKDSDTKFIISDHPVTLYNARISPSDRSCNYPLDPDISLVGTQTVFPLSEDYCLILTHLDYAENPTTSDLMKRRINARFRGQAIGRKDLWIRTRSLTNVEVTALNLLIKKRAKRYIAAYKPEWLYPENSYAGEWSEIAKILLPRQQDLFGFGGEIYIAYKDGSSSYHDPYGRTSRSSELLKRKHTAANPQLNEGCGCGSGKHFESCCYALSAEIRPTWEVFSIRERNLMLCNALVKILGINEKKTWEDARRDITDDQVRKIHQFVSLIWPPDTDLTELLPRQNSKILRAVYLGAPDARTITLTILSWLAYFDEIIITFPFLNPELTKNPQFNPISQPSEYKDQTIRNTFLMFMLQPFIELGLVHVIPDPGDFNSEFGSAVREMAQIRTKNWTVPSSDTALHQKVMQTDMINDYARLPMPSLIAYIKKIAPDIPEDLLEQVAKNFKESAIADPLAPLQEVGGSGQLRVLKGFNLETSLFLAMLTGAVILTDIHDHKKQLYSFANARDLTSNPKFNEVLKFTNTLEFPLQLNSLIIYEALKDGLGSEIRQALLSVVEHARKSTSTVDTSHLINEIEKGMMLITNSEAMNDSDLIQAKLNMEIPLNGFDRNEVRRLLLTFSRPELVNTVPVLFYVKYPELKFNRYSIND